MKITDRRTPANMAQLKLRDLCRLHTNEAVERIVELMRNAKTPKNVALAAATHLLDRGFGKPVQTTELTGKDGENLFANMSSEELKEEVRRRLTDPQTLRDLGIDADVVKLIASGNVHPPNGRAN